ncbi:MAG TPA: single-stranded DNA-binding protein [Candidatus Hydrogenedentes bacterium]|mgnify:FL=1|nr:single-stranded DNA-binding protein [Candidatus Hydrogenedentota bacterium]
MSDLRMPDLNKVLLAGRLTRDPELKYIASGKAVCKMGLAVSRKCKTGDGEQREETLFINVTAWDKSAEFCGQYLRKGKPVMVEGALKPNEWEDKATGQKRSTIEIRADRIQQLDWDDQRSGGSPRPEPRVIEEPIPEDDIPF